ncbi:MAG: ATP-binding protein [Gemmiger sp.]
MSGRSPFRRLLFSIRSYLSFFLLISFVTTCCMLLFLNTLGHSMHLAYTEDTIRAAAVVTFGNVVFLSLLYTVIDGVRRRYRVERPVRRIVAGAEKLMQGDFSARIEPLRGIDSEPGFTIIIDCFNRMAQELSGVETLRTDFIANVSHELKTPLAVIQNYATMLQSAALPDEKRTEYAQAIAGQSRRLADLITDILKLNRLENQQIYPAAKRYNLGEQLAACLLSFESTWEKKNIDMETDLEEELFVESDEELLCLVWNNLFSNALKFTGDGGAVSVVLKAEGDAAVVKVSDTGCGISPETGRHIFEKFYQGDTSHAAQGNGLGLALVKRVVDIVGGEISVTSEVGKGSVFTVKIRRAARSRTDP